MQKALGYLMLMRTEVFVIIQKYRYCKAKLGKEFHELAMAKNLFKGSFRKGDKHVVVSLFILLWADEKVNYAYAPQLDLTGYGYSEEEAKDSFNHQLDEFLAYTINKNTLFKELNKLGWEASKRNKKVTAPTEDKLLTDNELFKDLLAKPGIHRETKDLELSL